MTDFRINRALMTVRSFTTLGDISTPFVDGDVVVPVCDGSGALYAHLVIGNNDVNIAIDRDPLNQDGNLTTLNAIAVGANNFGFNGVTWDRSRIASTTNFAADIQRGVMLTAAPRYWAVGAAPATDLQATITKAAGGVGVVHVCTGLLASFVIRSNSTPNPTGVNLRDGATGVGPLLLTTLATGSAQGDGDTMQFNLTGLSIVGSANTAMTWEFGGAGGTNVLQRVTLIGYSVQT